MILKVFVFKTAFDITFRTVNIGYTPKYYFDIYFILPNTYVVLKITNKNHV